LHHEIIKVLKNKLNILILKLVAIVANGEPSVTDMDSGFSSVIIKEGKIK
jgi:hypothetical protein